MESQIPKLSNPIGDYKMLTKALIKVLYMAESTMLKKRWFKMNKEFIGTDEERINCSVVSQFIDQRMIKYAIKDNPN